jgi:hypothetical protein
MLPQIPSNKHTQGSLAQLVERSPAPWRLLQSFKISSKTFTRLSVTDCLDADETSIAVRVLILRPVPGADLSVGQGVVVSQRSCHEDPGCQRKVVEFESHRSQFSFRFASQQSLLPSLYFFLSLFPSNIYQSANRQHRYFIQRGA